MLIWAAESTAHSIIVSNLERRLEAKSESNAHLHAMSVEPVKHRIADVQTYDCSSRGVVFGDSSDI